MSVIFVDRKKNPKGRSVGNCQRFTKRARARLRERLGDAIVKQRIKGGLTGTTVPIPDRGIISEPILRPDPSSGGVHGRVFVGNKQFVKGDKIPKSSGSGGGSGGSGSGDGASDSGESTDDFQFALTRDEFLDLFFEGLELPDLIKTDLQETVLWKRHRAGFVSAGIPPNLNVRRTMLRSKGRRTAFRRPSREELEAVSKEIDELNNCPDLDKDPEKKERLRVLLEMYERLSLRRRVVPFIDPHDLRFNQYERRPEPNTKAVMFCLMDVSGSMGEHEKTLAKTFFLFLKVFLERQYGNTDVVFIRHTHEAQEVDEETFFYSQESGGTVVSTALALTREIILDRYLNGQWNIYVAQASDGDNYSGDSEKCVTLLHDMLMPLLQFFFYVEILDERESEFTKDESEGAELWQAYIDFCGGEKSQKVQNFAMRRVGSIGSVYPVFRSLFEKRERR